MGVITNSDTYYLEETKTHFVVHGVDVELRSKLCPGTKGLIVCAHRLSLVENISLPSGSVELIAEEIRCASNISIDVSGPPGSAPGEPGRNAGRVKILGRRLVGELTVLAKGGQGGQGRPVPPQPKHPPGADGADMSLTYGNTESAKPGADGPTGYTGSEGEQGAPGGAGGEVEIRLIEAPPTGAIRVDVGRGVGGAGGPPGKGGPPGDPGRGGRKRFCYPDPTQ